MKLNNLKFNKRRTARRYRKAKNVLTTPVNKTIVVPLLILSILVTANYLLLQTNLPDTTPVEITTPFPISVDPVNKKITENPEVENFIREHLAYTRKENNNWFNNLFTHLSKWDLYQQLASPGSRILVIFPGERKEEITKNFGDILDWDKTERKKFKNTVSKAKPTLTEGKFFPGRYLVEKNITPTGMAGKLNKRFTEEIVFRYTDNVSDQVPLKNALIIASLLEREAYDFNDMRYISGIIWNRLFDDMPLQLDASLQYVKGSNIYEPKWWPLVQPADKFTASPFNTYKHKGLPPNPIANPSVEAVIAALNPRVTDCMFYFHDQHGGFHCSKNYAEHLSRLKEVY